MALVGLAALHHVSGGIGVVAGRELAELRFGPAERVGDVQPRRSPVVGHRGEQRLELGVAEVIPDRDRTKTISDWAPCARCRRQVRGHRYVSVLYTLIHVVEIECYAITELSSNTHRPLVVRRSLQAILEKHDVRRR